MRSPNLRANQAVAIYYEQDVTQLPIILTIGKALIAKQVVKLTKEEKIVIDNDRLLAEELAEPGKIDQQVPSNCLAEVGKVMRQVIGIKNRE